jgi:Xaa-Pro aminopeptidase
MNERIDKASCALKRLRMEAFLVSNPSNIFYLSGFSGHDSLLLITRSGVYIITDFRYEEEAQACANGFIVISDKAGLYEKAARIIKKDGIRGIGFEAHHMTVRDKGLLSSTIKAKLAATSGIIEKLRMIKEEQEIEKIKESAGIIKRVFKQISKDVKPGTSEKGIASRVDFLAGNLGSDKPSFNTIVLSGKRTSMPHGRPSGRSIMKGDTVMIDSGAQLNGYSSDLTRMLFMGRISKYINILYSIVKTAQQEAIAKIKPGIKASEIDRAARSYIYDKGFGKYFGHSTGHGIGIDVHEFPSISSKNHTKLKAGMVFSVEPGIYIPGKIGVRMEDMVVVTKNGCEVITR